MSDETNDKLLSPKEKTICDTIYSFLGKPVLINDSVYEQISDIANHDEMLSYNDSILQIGDVRWRVNINIKDIVLLTSVNPDETSMKSVIKYLNNIYGQPYDDEEDGFDIKWSSSPDPNNIFNGACTLVHLRSVRSEEGGTALFFM